jgi:hypothetical protein
MGDLVASTTGPKVQALIDAPENLPPASLLAETPLRPMRVTGLALKRLPASSITTDR